MEVEAAREDVRAGKTAEAEVRSVGAATDRLHLGLHAGVFNGLLGYLDDAVVRFHLLAHVIVLVFNNRRGGAGAVAGVDGVGCALHHGLFLLELCAVVIADDIGHVGFLNCALE